MANPRDVYELDRQRKIRKAEEEITRLQREIEYQEERIMRLEVAKK